MSTSIATDKFVAVNGVRLHYLDWGTAGKLPLVCLHGHTGQAHIWDEFATAMSRHYHVYTLDQRGHGDSQWASDGYARDKFVADLEAFVDSLALKRFVIAGLSMGGWNAILYAAAHPARVERVVLVDISPEVSQQFRVQRTNRPTVPLQFNSFEEAVAWARQSNALTTEECFRKDLAHRLRRRDDGTWVWKADPLLFTTPLTDVDDSKMIARYWRSFRDITCPILLVRGKESPLVSNDILARMRKANPDFSYVDVAGAGHVVTVDQPEGFIAAARGFLGVAE